MSETERLRAALRRAIDLLTALGRVDDVLHLRVALSPEPTAPTKGEAMRKVTDESGQRRRCMVCSRFADECTCAAKAGERCERCGRDANHVGGRFGPPCPACSTGKGARP